MLGGMSALGTDQPPTSGGEKRILICPIVENLPALLPHVFAGSRCGPGASRVNCGVYMIILPLRQHFPRLPLQPPILSLSFCLESSTQSPFLPQS